MRNLCNIALRNLRRYTRRSLLTISLIAFGVMFVLVFVAVTGSFKQLIITQITDSYLGDLQIHRRGYVASIETQPLPRNRRGPIVDRWTDVRQRYRAGADDSGADPRYGDVCWLYAVWHSWSTHRDGQHLSPFLLVVGLVPNFDKLRRSLSFNNTLNGVLCSFVGILLMTTVRFANVPWEIARTLLASATFVALVLQVESICVVVIGTAVSVLVL